MTPEGRDQLAGEPTLATVKRAVVDWQDLHAHEAKVVLVMNRSNVLFIVMPYRDDGARKVRVRRPMTAAAIASWLDFALAHPADDVLEIPAAEFNDRSDQ